MRKLGALFIVLSVCSSMAATVFHSSLYAPSYGHWETVVEVTKSMSTASTLPHDPSFDVSGSLTIENNTIVAGFSDVGANGWPYLGIQMLLMHDPVKVAIEIRSTLPSRSVSINPWFSLLVGETQRPLRWTVGAQGGLFMAPMPNQRPMGPAIAGNVFASVRYALHPDVSVGIHVDWAKNVGSFTFSTIFESDRVSIDFSVPWHWKYNNQGMTLFDPMFRVALACYLGGVT